ncbi:MAG: adenylate/guanylate cyclase domain-containing protein [Acidimicrobiales bacterium]
MTSIRCLPDDVVVDVDGRPDLLSALLGADVPIAHDCGGKARCSTCRVRILDGQDALNVRSAKERAIADRLGLPAEIRLACQTYAERAVTLQRLVLDELDGVLADQTARKRALGAVGREAEIAVVLADVVGYTTLSDALPAYDIVHILNRFFRGASRGVERHGGRVDNYMGDAILAFFGLDGTGDASGSAVRAGFEILEAARSVSSYVDQLYGRSFAVRIGVHHGRVVVGSVGGEGSARETAIGEAVNIASRLEAANKELGTDMLVSSDVTRQCGDALTVGRRFDVELRGITGGIEAFEPIAIR